MNEKVIAHYIARFAQMYDFLDEKKYRDYCIEEEFNILKSQGIKVEEIELKLSEKFSSEKYPLTPESIHDIIYRERKKV